MNPGHQHPYIYQQSTIFQKSTFAKTYLELDGFFLAEYASK